jgi:hypothetical protein
VGVALSGMGVVVLGAKLPQLVKSRTDTINKIKKE